MKEAKKIADVTSGIEAMSSSNQDASVSARRGATVTSPPGTIKAFINSIMCVHDFVVTGVKNDSSTTSNPGVRLTSSFSFHLVYFLG